MDCGIKLWIVESNCRLWNQIVDCGIKCGLWNKLWNVEFHNIECGIFHIPQSSKWKFFPNSKKGGGIRQSIFAPAALSFVPEFHIRVSTVRGKSHKIPSLPEVRNLITEKSTNGQLCS
jgi:hypothetical protein